MLHDELDGLAEQSLQQVGHLRHDVRKLEDLRAQGLLPREGKKLSSEARGAVGIRLDLLDVVIVAVSRRMAHQHEVAMADDRGQDIVEIVSDPAGELSDHLHLGCLGDLPLELGFLAIVLQQQQDRGIAEAAKPRDGQSDRVRSLVSQAHCKIARHRRPARIAADGIRDGRLVLLHHQIARVDRHARPLEPSSLAESAVHRQEPAVPVDERQTDREHVEQRLQVRRIAHRFPGAARVEQKEGAGARFGARIGWNMDRTERPTGFSLRQQAHLIAVADLDQISETRLLHCVPGRDRSVGKQAVRHEEFALCIDDRSKDARRG